MQLQHAMTEEEFMLGIKVMPLIIYLISSFIQSFGLANINYF